LDSSDEEYQEEAYEKLDEYKKNQRNNTNLPLNNETASNLINKDISEDEKEDSKNYQGEYKN